MIDVCGIQVLCIRITPNKHFLRIITFVKYACLQFNPKEVTYPQLLAKFWKEHSPYSNCSGQYMNAVWYYSEEQKAAIDASIASLGGDKVKTTGELVMNGKVSA